MKNALSDFLRTHDVEVVLGLGAAVVVGVFSLIKARFAAEAAKWPSVRARIENLFLDVADRGPNHYPTTHAVLAYGYSVDSAYYSGQIRLLAGEASLETLNREMVGREISIQHNPTNPGISIFLKHRVWGWDVVRDRRLSLWAWFENIS